MEYWNNNGWTSESFKYQCHILIDQDVIDLFKVWIRKPDQISVVISIPPEWGMIKFSIWIDSIEDLIIAAFKGSMCV